MLPPFIYACQQVTHFSVTSVTNHYLNESNKCKPLVQYASIVGLNKLARLSEMIKYAN